MKDLLGDNIVLRRRMDEVQKAGAHQLVLSSSSPKFREVATCNPMTWISCFLLFIAVRCTDTEMRPLLIYAKLILDMARKHGGRGWLEYDNIFHQQMATNPVYTWWEINPSLMSCTIIAPDTTQSKGVWYTLYQDSDHRAFDCALRTLEPQAASGFPKVIGTALSLNPQRAKGDSFPIACKRCVENTTGRHATMRHANTATSAWSVEKIILQCRAPMERKPGGHNYRIYIISSFIYLLN